MPLNAGKVCFVSGKSQRTWGSKVHTSLKSDVEVWLRRSPEYLGQTVIPPIFIAALMLFILKTFLFLRPVTAVALKFCLCASFILNLSVHTMASESQTSRFLKPMPSLIFLVVNSRYFVSVFAAKEYSVFDSWQGGKASETWKMWETPGCTRCLNGKLITAKLDKCAKKTRTTVLSETEGHIWQKKKMA